MELFKTLPTIIAKKYVVICNIEEWKNNNNNDVYISVYRLCNENQHYRHLYKIIDNKLYIHILNVFSKSGRALLSSGNGFIVKTMDNEKYWTKDYKLKPRHLSLVSEESIFEEIEIYINNMYVDNNSSTF